MSKPHARQPPPAFAAAGHGASRGRFFVLAFSSEVNTGSHEENASKKES